MSDVTIEIAGVKHKMRALRKFFEGNRQLLEQIGVFASQQIIKRTMSGRDYNNRLFKPYSPQYAIARQNAGRPANPVDLFFTGRMQAAMTHKTETDPPGVRLFFSAPQQGMIAAAHHYGLGRLRNAKREFFAINDDDRKYITAMLSEGLRAITEE